ncbi:hypothetical protein AVEN_6274-1, partial [Araneus ventricosus]
MSSYKDVKKTGILKTSTPFSQVKSSKVNTFSYSETPENEKTMYAKCALFDGELLSNDVKEVKRFTEKRKSSLASKSRKTLEVFDVASNNSWRNGSNTIEYKETGKTIDHKIMKSASSRDARMEEMNKENNEFESEPMQYERSKTKSEMKRGKWDTKQVSKNLSVTPKFPVVSNLESSHKLRPKYKKLYSDDLQMKNCEEALNLQDHNVMKSASNRDATTEEKNKEKYEFESEPKHYKKSKVVTMFEMERRKRDTKQVNIKPPVT